MAFLDDRVWCHPKWVPLSPDAFRAGISAICYAHGFHTGGELSTAALRMIGATDEITAELVTVGLWERNAGRNAGVTIHDWEDYNSVEAAIERRRERGRERAQRYRERHKGVTGNGPGNGAMRHSDSVTEASQRNGSESESDSPLPTASRGDLVTCKSCGKLTPPRAACQHCGVNPRTAGTNPRALAEQAKSGAHDALLAAGIESVATWLDPVGTDVLHERLDALEAFHGSSFTNAERERIIDHALGQWRT